MTARPNDRHELEARLRRAEETLSAIEEETRHALHHPEISVMTLCRISTLVLLARASLEDDDGRDDSSEI